MASSLQEIKAQITDAFVELPVARRPWFLISLAQFLNSLLDTLDS